MAAGGRRVALAEKSISGGNIGARARQYLPKQTRPAPVLNFFKLPPARASEPKLSSFSSTSENSRPATRDNIN